MTSPEPRPGGPLTVAIVGTGLIGTSVALAAARAGDRVRGHDVDRGVLERSASLSGLEPAGSLAEAVDGADVVVVCTPIPAIPEAVTSALEGSDAVVTDAGSVKASIIARLEVEGSERPGSLDLSRYVGGHPMGGSERTGPDAASASILDDAVWVLTPGPATDPAATALLEGWVARIGARPVVMEPERHDRLVAIVSHLPQLVSTALMSLAIEEESDEPELLLLAAGGFRDLTRLAGSSPPLWRDILRSNPEELARAVDLYLDRLGALRDAVTADRAGPLEDALAAAKRARLELAAKPSVKAGVAVLLVPVPDRPGVLADLTAAMSERSVNIEDLQIVHSPEGGRGTVHLTVAAADAEPAAQALSAHGFAAVRLA
jgi:prephenate dehydrogenase